MHGRSRRRRPGSSSHDAESPSPSPSPSKTIAMIDAAVVKAHSDHLAAGESISAWRVSQSALVTLKADSFESLGLRMQNVPSLYRIMVTEAKVNSFIHCFVAVQKITSLYDLELAICESEGIKGFEELELGPLLKHPLVAHYFSAGCDVTEMFKITSEQVISYLNILLYKKKKITVDDLLDYIAKRTDQSRENLCIRIQSLGMHIGHIMRGRRSEFTLLKKCSDGLNVKLDHDDNEGDIAEDEDNDKNDDARICLDTKMDYSFTSQDGKRCNHQVALSEGPEMKHTVHKTPRQMPDGRLIKRGSRADNVETGFIDNNEVDGHTWMFIRIWREMCKTENVVEAFDQMLDFYKGKMSTKKKDKALKSMLSSYPHFGLLNVAIASIKFGMWDCISNAPQAKTCAVDANIEVETAKMGILGAGKHVLESCVDKNGDAQDCGIFSSETATSSEPSAAAQVPRIWLDTEVDYGFTSSHDCKSHHDHVAPSQGKQDKGCTKQIHKRPRVTPFGRLINSGFLADNTETGFIDNHEIYGHMRIFIKIWTEICKTKNVAEAFDLMLDFYNGQMTEKKKNKALRSMLSSYPEFGLLNVAIASIKFGMWDHISIAPQANSKEVLANTIFKTHTVDVNTEDEPAEKDVPAPDVALEDILKNISAYFEFSKHVPDNINAYPKIQSIFLREFCKLEHWLTGQFSINDFEALGFGEFFTFLEEHVSLLPTAWQDCFLTIDKNEKPSVKVCMNQYYLHEFLSQAVNSLNEHETLSESMVSELLQIQYPFAGLELVKDDFTTNLLTNVSKNRNLSSNILLFSSTLSNFRTEKHLLDTCVGTKDAIELLLTAPMLVDLTLWSYWDHRFAPSLGPILGWLVSEVTSKELLCLVTRDGKVLRIDHSATVDSFLEAFLHRSSFQTAVQLLSLLALYGGERNVPLSLLKCHAKSAFEVMLKISSDTKVNNNQRFLATEVNKSAVPSASRFLLDCLGYLPNEFRSFAADLLISAFRSIIKDAHLVILHECKHKDDHLMLHELGLLLGIVEWFDDYCTCRLSESEESFERMSKRFSLKDVVTPSLEVKLPSDDCKRERVIMHSVQSAEIANNAANIIESIRREEFGLDPNLSVTESSVLKKQHARLGRALHCLSQELYSQDSHFLLELVQNADDNVYSRNVEPTLTFILQDKSIVVLNNEHGFSAENIRALCDVGNSTKKASSAGYIGKKGIGFKSVFRVTDAPEIHSNGFHIKFDLSEGQIGFVLPTIVPPCDINLFTNLVPLDPTDQVNKCHWNTCIVLPFKSKLTENIVSMFSDLHPSLLLFLHRLQCIKFRNRLDDSFVIMRKEIVGNGLVNVSNGNEILTWFVESRELQANIVRDDVKTTEISIAFALELSGHDNYIPKLDQQYVFAFLPLRTYGLKFIIQGDFILPSSREEVDGDSSWNQWLLTEFPSLFVSSEKLFCCLPGFRDSLGKGISVFLSYVPLVGEVHGFFANLPRMIISKLCMSNCLLLEGDNTKWVPPCRVLRNWNEKVRDLLPDSLIHKHLGLGYLNKDIVLSDSLAKALGIESYGPKILVRILSSLCRTKGLPSMGLGWLSSWLNALYEMSGQSSVDYDIMNTLKKTPFIPLLDGCYGSIEEGMIWMNLDTLCTTDFAKLFNKLRIVNPALLDCSITENLTRMLSKVGVQRLSAHEVVKSHVLPAISDKMNTITSKDLMTEYLSFIMVHVQSGCPDCSVEREHIISEVYNKAFILTNHGFIRPVETAIHFDNDFGNDIDMGRLINDMDIKWFEVDKTYLKYGDMLNWRKFLQEIRVTDFVQTVRVEKTGSNIVDWESEELASLLLSVSSSGDLEKCKLLLEVLDAIWDDYFGDKVVALCKIDGENKPFKSALVSTLNAVRWVASSVDDRLYCPKDLFNDCEAVCSILGDNAPYAVPKVRSKKLVTSIGFKTAVTIDDALSVLEVWKRSGTSFNASISQMSRFYSFIWNELASSNQKNTENLLSGAFIFVPFSSTSSSEVVPGVLLSPQEVYWHDHTINPQYEFSKILSNLYPSLHGFFVNECGVKENPPLLGYIESLRHLSTVDTPSKAAKRVFDVFVMWSNGLDSGQLSFDDVQVLKKSLEEKEMRVLPTAHDMWVSLHPSFGLVCWCDDKKLANEFEELNNIDFLHLCELDDQEKVMLRVKVSVLMHRLGIPALSEVVTREAIYYGPVDNSFETSLVSWALPYAQRYISNVYRERYLQLKLSGFEKLNRLQIVVVEKLFYKNVIKRSKLASKKRHDSSCLLQGEILYARRELDPHSIFMELSRFLVNGKPELHLANFLHMITTMTESGSTEEQIETFISNNQKVPKLLDNEPVWSIQVQPIALTASAATSISKRIIEPMPNTSNFGRKSRSNSNWPPVNWKTAPRFVNDLNMQDIAKRIDFNAYSIEEQPQHLEHSRSSNDNVLEHDLVDQDGAPRFSQRDQLSHGSVNVQQAVLTGRLGEEVAFNYYTGKFGFKFVKWVNEDNETGLPYDIEICDDKNGKEFIEVKTTDSAQKDWFEVSVKEWEFAVEKGEYFSIARVVLLGDGTGRVTEFKNPARLCRTGHLKLAVVMAVKKD